MRSPGASRLSVPITTGSSFWSSLFNQRDRRSVCASGAVQLIPASSARENGPGFPRRCYYRYAGIKYCHSKMEGLHGSEPIDERNNVGSRLRPTKNCHASRPTSSDSTPSQAQQYRANFRCPHRFPELAIRFPTPRNFTSLSNSSRGSRGAAMASEGILREDHLGVRRYASMEDC
jgi:hypothetical protein